MIKIVRDVHGKEAEFEVYARPYVYLFTADTFDLAYQWLQEYMAGRRDFTGLPKDFPPFFFCSL